jgi:hypothetical protein
MRPVYYVEIKGITKTCKVEMEDLIETLQAVENEDAYISNKKLGDVLLELDVIQTPGSQWSPATASENFYSFRKNMFEMYEKYLDFFRKE